MRWRCGSGLVSFWGDRCDGIGMAVFGGSRLVLFGLVGAYSYGRSEGFVMVMVLGSWACGWWRLWAMVVDS